MAKTTVKKKTGLMKKYIKLAGGDFKKAWRLQKAAKSKTANARKKVTRKKAVKKKVVRKKAVRKKTVPKKVTRKKAVRRKVAKKPQRKPVQKRKVASMAKKKKTTTRRRRRRNPGAGKPMELLTNGAIGLGGAIGSGIVANMLPIPQPGLKAALPLAVGVGVALSPMAKMKGAQYFALGAMIMGGIALTKQFAPQIPFIAGEDEMLDYVGPGYEEQAMLGMEDESIYDDDLAGESFSIDGESEDIDEMEGEFISTADI